MNDLIINFTPTGMIPTKEQTPHVPVTSAEIIRDVKEAWELGITTAHLHVRDPLTHEPGYKKEAYSELISGIREFAPELVICVSTSGRSFSDFARRSEVLQLKGDLKPDMGSLTLSSLNFNKQASINEPAMIMDLAKLMLDNGIKPELEVFDSGMINYGKYLIRKGLLKPPYYFTFILGNIACAQVDLLHIGMMIKDLPEGALFSLGGVGKNQLTANSLAVSMGYGVRVGLEDNIWYDLSRTRLATNYELLQRIHDMACANQRQIMPSSCFRRLLELNSNCNS
mgnify:CR=1 FL=1|jgi:uncharacterized protein (DUF849 family)